ncbi:MAG: tetratricopeptide repeat protein [Chitinophagales bacterium]|nr:tetratricopeptide repeat protein [Chitinophagales bacterium]
MFTKKMVVSAMAVIFSGSLFGQTLQEGIRMFQMENYDGAKNTFETLTQKEPTNGINFYYLGEVKFTTGDVSGAKAAFTKGSEVAPKEGSNFAGLAKIAMEENKVADAKAQADKATSLGKKDPLVWNRTAEAFYEAKNKDFAKAEALLEQSKTLNAQNPDTYIHLGDMFMEKKDISSASRSYEYATDYDAKNFYAFYKMGKIYFKINPEKALEYYLKSAAIEPNFPPVNRDLSDLYSDKKDYQKAKDYFGKYASLAENKIDVKERYARILYIAKDFNAAITEATEFLKSYPDNIVMHRLIAYSSLELNKDADAETYFNKLFKIAPADKIMPTDYEFYVKLLEKQGKDSIALLYKVKMIELDPAKADMYSDMASNYFKLKKYDMAAKMYQNAIDKKKKVSVNDYLGLGSSYYYNKEYQNADQAFAKAAEMAPTSVTAYQWRAKSNARIDVDFSKGLAVPHYQKVLELATDTAKYKNELIESNKYLGKFNAIKDGETGFAQGNGVPFYTKVAELASSDPVKYKNELVEAYKYLGSYYGVMNDLANYKSYWLKVKDLAPDDKDLQQVLDYIK